MTTVDAPRLLVLTNDLFLQPRLEDAAAALGFAFQRFNREEITSELGDHPVPLTEPLEGTDGALVRSIVGDPPALILIDLASDGVPWQRWIQILKTSSATRRIPIVAFGPHVESEALDRASQLGADRVVTRGQLQTNLAEILQREARPPDAAAIQEGCGQPASAAARQGMVHLAAGAYFEAHDHLERAVLDSPGPEGAVYRCLLHLAVACLHTERGNWRGAQKMLLRMRPWLAPLPGVCRQVDVESLRAALSDHQARLDRWQSSGEAPASPLPPPSVRFLTELPG